MRSKACRACARILPLDEFNRNKNAKDGRSGRCKDCHAEYMRTWRESRRRDPEYRAKRQLVMRRQRRAHPKKYAARMAVLAALKSGELVRGGVCEDCGHDFSEFRREAHHEDYDQPMVVAWLCSRCHGHRHRRSR